MKQKKCGGKRVRWLILLRIGQLPIVVFINKIDKVLYRTHINLGAAYRIS